MWFYKIYCWFYAALTLYVIRNILVSGIFSNFWALLVYLAVIAVFALAAIGLYLYAYGKKWLPLTFWKIFTLLDFAGQFFIFFKEPHFLEALLTLLLLSPLYLALFRYSFSKAKH